MLLRLPLEIKDLFREWLEEKEPGRAKHVMSLVRQMRGGKDYDSTWHTRMRGTGPYAEMIARRFHMAVRRLGLNRGTSPLTVDKVPHAGAGAVISWRAVSARAGPLARVWRAIIVGCG